jgi:diguanylate cyclase (GGDEF)-like protein
MQAQETTELAPGRPRYPMAFAVAWIGAFAAIDWAASGTWRAEPAYIPVVAAIAGYYGTRSGLWLAALATIAVTSVDLAFSPRPGAIGLTWSLVANACIYALPAWLAGELGRSKRRLAMLMTTDAESGLLNRSGLLARIGDELLRTERFGGDLSILAIGINGLQRFEEERGADETQRLLFGFSEALRVVARRTDVVARLGDFEFALLLPGTGTATSQVVADRHQRVLGEWLRTQAPALTCSVGRTTAPLGRGLAAPALLACAVADMEEQRPGAARKAEATGGEPAPSGGSLVPG